MKKVLSVLLTIAMLVALLPFGSFAAIANNTTDGFVWAICDDGETASITKYTGSATEVIIPETIEGYKVKAIGDYAFYGCSDLTSVTIPESVTSIGDYAFWECNGLTEVHISDIAAWCNIQFSDSNSNPLFYTNHLYLNGELITELVIPDGVTSIGSYSFRKWSYLTSVTIPESVTSIGDYAFADCSGLTRITIPANVTSIGEGTFSNCIGLTSIAIPDSVTSIGESAFYGCNNLTRLTLGNSVMSIGEYAFDGCSSLTEVHISDIAAWCNIQFSNSTSHPLYYANNLYLDGELIAELVIPDSVTSIRSSAFRGCSSLTSVTVPDSVTSIGEDAFAWCTNLTKVTLSNSVTSIEGAFHGCSSLTSITIPEGLTGIGNYTFAQCNSLTSIIIPESVTSIGDYAFSRCTGLTSITIPDNVASIGEGAFWACNGLTRVTIPNSVTNIVDYAFYGCNGLTDVYYKGSETGRQKIKIGTNNSALLNATWHYMIEFEGAQITLGDDLGVTFAVSIHDEVFIDDMQMKFTVNDTVTYAPINVIKNGLYYFTVEVAAKDMNTPITTQLIDADGNEYGYKVYTVKEYGEAIINGNYSKKEITAAKAMLNYGAAAQAYFNHSIDTLANANCAYTQDEIETIDLSGIPQLNATNSLSSFKGVSLMLKSKTAVRLYFDEQVSGAQHNQNGWYVETSGIDAGNLATVYSIDIDKATYTFSALSFAKAVIEGDYSDAFKYLMKTLILYSDAAVDLITTENDDETEII